MKNIYDIFNKLEIKYKEYKHPAVYTCEEAKKYKNDLEEVSIKNLFLRNKKGNKYFLLICKADKNLDLKKLSKLIDEKKIGFASTDRLLNILNLTPGSVSPFGLINDKEKKVIVLLDEDLLKCEVLNFHPNVNTATVQISKSDFLKFLEWRGNEFREIKL